MKKTKCLFLGLSLFGLLLTGCGQAGPQGPQGEQGLNGQNGVSVVSIIKTASNGLVDTYTITYSNNTTSTFTVTNGADGAAGSPGIQGIPGADGHTPVITIGNNGHWFVDDVDTGIKAQGEQGLNGQNGVSVLSIEYTSSDGLVDTYTIKYSNNTTSTFTVTNGADGQNGQSIKGEPGQDGHSPAITIGSNGDWFIDGVDSGIKAQGPQGPAGQNGVSVVSVVKTSSNGLIDTYTISYSNNTTSTFTVTNGADGQNGQSIKGEPGQDGHTPVITIGDNGHWFVDDVDTGVKAQGEKGNDSDLYGVTYTITFNPNGGQLPDGCQNSIEVPALHTIELPVPTKTGFIFNGWYTGDTINDGKFTNATPVSKDLTLYARWYTETYYTLSLYDGMSLINATDYLLGTEIDIPVAPAKADYTFAGWYLDSGFNSKATFPFVLENNVNLYARYTDAYYTVTFHNGAGVVDSQVSYKAGTVIDALPSYSEMYKNFLGWYLDSEFNEAIILPYEIHQDIDLYAKLENIRVTLTLNYNYNSLVTSEKYDAGTYVTLPTPSRYGYIFDGWYLNAAKYTDSFTITNDLTLVAKWTYDSTAFLTFEGGVVSAKDTDISGEIVIPSSYNGVEITAIKSNGFVGCDKITKLVIPNTISSIPSGCLAGCVSLGELSIPYCGISPNASSYSAHFGIIFGTQSYAGTTTVKQHYDTTVNTKNYSIPSGLTTVHLTGTTKIANYAFQNMTMIREVSVECAISSVGSYAFDCCSNLTTIALPNVGGISDYCFSECARLSDFVVGNKVNRFGDYSFYCCTSITHLDLPTATASIGEYAFAGCGAMSSFGENNEGFFTLHNNISTIGVSAFAGCSLMISYTAPFIGTSPNATGTDGHFGCIFGSKSYSGTTSIKQHYDTTVNTKTYYLPSGLATVCIMNATRVPAYAFQNTAPVIKALFLNTAAQYSVGTDAFDNAPSPAYILA